MKEAPLFAMPWVSVEVPPPDVGGMVSAPLGRSVKIAGLDLMPWDSVEVPPPYVGGMVARHWG